MEQRSREDGMQQQDQGPRRPKLTENQMPPHQPQPPPPQKCPRCDSQNTKFCYYNNYSLSQPRYFCKTCRRYWTQGGTLRNVPVGGGCRKGKRPKISSSSSGENSRSLPNLQPPPPPLPAHQQQLQLPPHMTSMAAMVSSIPGITPTSQSLKNLPWGHAPTSSLYPSGGLLSSLAAMQSLSRPQGINQPINLGGTGASPSANIPIFQGFDFPSSMKSLQVQPLQMHQSAGFQGMVDQEKDGEPFYPPHQNMGQPARTLNSWNHGDNNTNPSSSNANFWNNSSSSTSSGMAGSSANTNQWPNLPGFGASP